MSYHGLLLFPLLALIAACSGIEPPSPEKDDGPVSIITGKSGGTKISEFFGNSQETVGMPVNALLWRAALEIVSFVPIEDVDTFGGSIVTDWHSLPSDTTQRIKIAVFIIGKELRSDAVSARVYVQNQIDGVWVQSGRDKSLETNVEDLILARARELRSSMINGIAE
jgi:hypothetical protein